MLNNSKSCRAPVRDFSDPLRISVVSSAYWLILISFPLIKIPSISLFVPSSETQGQLVGAGRSQLVGAGRLSSPEFFLARFDLFPPPLTAPGSPRMCLS